MSDTGPFEGTLLVNPLLQLATSYYLLRPFFVPKQKHATLVDNFLKPTNWELREEPDSWLQGATPGRGQELRDFLHPHLRLENSMVHVPKVQPGDYVSWHCDTIHAVDSVHMGQSDSSVLYIPTCPLTELNAQYMLRQRKAFLDGTPGPDFPGGEGESRHIGKPTVDDVAEWTGLEGMVSDETGLTLVMNDYLFVNSGALDWRVGIVQSPISRLVNGRSWIVQTSCSNSTLKKSGKRGVI